MEATRGNLIALFSRSDPILPGERLMGMLKKPKRNVDTHQHTNLVSNKLIRVKVHLVRPNLVNRVLRLFCQQDSAQGENVLNKFLIDCLHNRRRPPGRLSLTLVLLQFFNDKNKYIQV